MRRLSWMVLLALSCIGSTDDSSQVHDLRVLAVKTEPPEIMAPPPAPPPAPFCNPLDPDAGFACLAPVFAAYAQPVKLTWLIEDPKGEGRALNYRVLACANQDDLRCEDVGDFAQLATGKWVADAGELTLTLFPGATTLDQGQQFLLQEVQAQDPYKGVGGLRMPIVIHLSAGDEEVFAQKLMVYSYPFFPGMKANVNPTLPGIRFVDGGEWGETEVVQLQGRPDAGIRLEPLPFTDLQETYVVPSFAFKPLTLTEAWKVAWHTDMGRFSPTETGGIGLDGELSRHRVTWTPMSTDLIERDVTFWFVVRDGRGGQTWISRQAHWKP